MTSAITTLPGNKSVVVCNLVLAPSVKPDDANTNSNVKFQIAVEPMEYGSVSNALRIMCEDSCSNCFLPFIVNRVLEETTIGTVAVELVYGNGFKTYCKRKDGLEVKSFKQLAVNLSIGSPNAQNIDSMPILMPEDDLYFHVASYATATGMKPTLYIRTGGPLFLYPADKSNATSIPLVVPTKRGYWTGAAFEGNRESYPKVLPTKPTFTRKRKKPEDGGSGEKEKATTSKKPKKDDKDKEDSEKSDSEPEKEEEEKPKKKAVPPTKKKTTPAKKTKKDDDDDDDTEDESPSKKKPTAKRGSVSKKTKKDESEDKDEKKDEPAKKATSRRKSKSSVKGGKK